MQGLTSCSVCIRLALLLLLLVHAAQAQPALFNTDDFPARWNCGDWSEPHGWTHILSDLVIWLAYTSIPVSILIVFRKRKGKVPYPQVWIMFSLFILSCGFTHLMESIIFWWPAYRLLGLLKVMTAIISAATAIALIPIIKKLFRMKTEEAAEQELKEVTETLEMEKVRAIEQQQDILDAILEESFAGYWDWDLVQGTEYLSPTFKAMFGYEDHEMENRPESWQKIIFPEDLLKAEENLARHVASRGKHPFDQTVRYRHKDGSTVHVICRGRVIEWDEKGDPQRMVGCHVNVTELVSIHEQLASRNEQLELLVRGINAGIWDWDLAAESDWWSPRCYELLGRTAEDTGCGYEAFEKLLHPDDVTMVEQALKKHFEQGTPYRLNVRLKHSDGEYRWIETSGAAKFDDEGKPMRMVGSWINVNERKLLEEENLRTIEMLSAHNDRLMSFAHIVSHNLRSHTGNIMTLLEMLADEDVEDREELMGHVSTSAAQLNETVEHLTEVVRIQADTQPALVEVRFDKVMSKILTTLDGSIKAAGARIRTDFERLQAIDYLPAYMESILLNLATNALKYRDAERPLEVSVTTSVKSGIKTLTFQDNGIGIDLSQHGEKIFGLYKTFHRNKDARGVGLFLIRNQVEALGGAISVSSEPGKGTCFRIQFDS